MISPREGVLEMTPGMGVLVREGVEEGYRRNEDDAIN